MSTPFGGDTGAERSRTRAANKLFLSLTRSLTFVYHAEKGFYLITRGVIHYCTR